jgi:hypothetical protein
VQLHLQLFFHHIRKSGFSAFIPIDWKFNKAILFGPTFDLEMLLFVVPSNYADWRKRE